MRRTLLYIVYAALVCAVCGCSMSADRWETLDLDNHRWATHENAVFEFSTHGTGYRESEIMIFIRSDRQLNPRNPRLVVKTIDPDALFWEDTITMPSAEGDMAVRASSFTLRRGIRWPKRGNYAISIRPEKPIEGIWSVGVKVANVNQKQ